MRTPRTPPPRTPRGAAAALAGVVVAGLAAAAPAAVAQCSACAVSVSAQPGRLTVTTAAAGSAPAATAEGTTTLRVVTDGSRTNVTAKLASSLPPGVTLQLRVSVSLPAASLGNVTLGTGESAVVGNLSAGGSPYTLPITYTLSATSAAGAVALGGRAVTFTLR